MIGDEAIVCVGMATAHGMQGGILRTRDFRRFEALCVVPPNNRDLVLFPEKVGGYYVRLERPMNDGAKRDAHPGEFGIYLSRSRDLEFWDSPRRILAAQEVPFANGRVGAGAPPIRTREGWLTIFHTVHGSDARGKNGWEPKWSNRYDAAIMLLDLEDPTRIRALARVPLLQPEAPYEVWDGKSFLSDGYRGSVVFPTAAVTGDDGIVRVYYGAADSFVCLATARLDDLVRFCLAGSR